MNTESLIHDADSITTQYYNEPWLHNNLEKTLQNPNFKVWSRTTIGNVVFCSEKISNRDIRHKYNLLLERYLCWYLQSNQI